MSLREAFLRSLRPLHASLRGHKADLFLQLVNGASETSLLDVGGGVGIAGEFAPVYRRFKIVVVANLRPGPSVVLQGTRVMPATADGCILPFPDKSFDWVFSNAVIEHVGGWQRQRCFAGEVRRVARLGYFVTTPNKYFPIEQHTLLPFYQFLPDDWKRVALRFSPGYVKEYEEINLLSQRNMAELFPEAEVKKVGTPVVANSLVAICRRSA